MVKLQRCLFFVLCLLISHVVCAQYILNGAAQQVSCNCYTLTPAQATQAGSVWNSNKINLQQSFDFWFTIFLGCNDNNGADGIVFILQPLSTSIGSTGEGMGFSGVTPSIGIALDTYQNAAQNDPPFDHISIQANGIVNHNSDLAGPVAASATNDNIEDCQWHKLRIVWDAASKVLSAYFDDSLRVQRQIDLVASIFNNDPDVFWGFTGATGGLSNLQQFCTALTPVFAANIPNNTACPGQPILFSGSSFSFAPIASYAWSFGDGTTSNLPQPPPKVYNQPGSYQVKLKITGQDGCEKDTSVSILIGNLPDARFQIGDTCEGSAPELFYSAPQTDITHQWSLNNVPLGAGAPPTLTNLSAGQYTLSLQSSSNLGCGAPDNHTAAFTIKPLPEVKAVFADGCTEETLSFNGQQLDLTTTITAWQWRIGSESFSLQQFTKAFNGQGQYAVRLEAIAANGCKSLPDTGTLKINRAVAFAGNDTTVVLNQPFTLQGNGNGTFSWQPGGLLTNSNSAAPAYIPTNDQQFILTVRTPEGCTQTDTVFIRALEGPTVYVPSAFTPNGDGRNDVLRPVYAGIKELRQFSVYNRWGNLVFRTSDKTKGWEGREGGGTYVWILEVIDHHNKPITLKGTVTLIK
jgi:gliding motility-associated-like protein